MRDGHRPDGRPRRVSPADNDPGCDCPLALEGPTITTSAATGAPTPSDHLVTFYEQDEFLVAAVADFLAPALEAGWPAVAIATYDHLVALEEEFRSRGLLPGGVGASSFVTGDAHEVLARITADGRVDAERLRAEVAAAIGPEGGPPARIFGEMVAVQWEQGDVAGAIELEDRWNELGATRDFTLFCGYPMSSFESEEHTDGFREVCGRHSSVIPSESYSALSDPDERLRLVARLQQEATAGANERLAPKRKQAELEDALAQLRELDRLRSEFTAMVVHDIRSPAGIASGFLELLLADWDELGPGEAEHLVERAHANVGRVQRLVDDILVMSQIDSGEFTFDLRPLDLGRVIQRTATELRATTGREIRVSVADGLPLALADEDRQVQILTNLVSNAVKFSSDEIRIDVAADDELVVTVADSGIGIAAADQEQLFRPFSRVNRPAVGAVRGTGLGLYISRALVEGQGGSLELESREGVGTTVSYTVLPALHHSTSGTS